MRNLLVIVAILMSTISAMTAAEPSISVSDGTLRGSVAYGVESWKGIPFAAPPVGNLRWRAPQPVEPWAGVRDASAFESDCPQLPLGLPFLDMRTQPSEDCLYLNVWRPEGSADRKLPVLVWIYGGGWVIGGASAPVYNPASLARQGVVAVSLNYRIGRFGWFAHPALTQADEDDGLFYNYGLLDQIAALRWIKRNIEAFGGDPDNVTLMGESAGGVSIHALTTSPKVENGLFHKAIVLSGADGGDFGTGDLSDAEGLGVNFAKRQSIDESDPKALEKLRALAVEEVIDGLTFGAPAYDPPTFNGGGPVEDGTIVAKIGQAYANNRFKPVPMMIGATANDLGGRTGFMVGGARRISSVLAAKGVKVFSYRFSYVAPAWIEKTATHASDLPFFLSTQKSVFGDRATPTDDAMAEAIRTRVIEFVKADPSNPTITGWPAFNEDDQKIMNFSEQGTADFIDDPWASEIDAAPPPQYPGLNAGGAEKGAPPTGDPSASRPPTGA
jgi:para-nitrobenzyl esterase